jgi:hypothetical protein
MAFYEVVREDENGYASAIVRAHGTGQAVRALSHLGFTAKNSVVERLADGRNLPVTILATVDEGSFTADDSTPPLYLGE